MKGQLSSWWFASTLLIIPFAELHAQRQPYPRLSVELGAGYAALSPDDINNFLAALGRKEIANGISLRGQNFRPSQHLRGVASSLAGGI